MEQTNSSGRQNGSVPEGMERSRPEKFTPPSDEELREAKEVHERLCKERDERVEHTFGKLFKEHLEDREKQGLSIGIAEGLKKHQLPRLDGQLEYLEKLMKSLPQVTWTYNGPPLKTKRGTLEKNPLIPDKATIEESFVVRSGNGEVMFCKVENGINELYRGTTHTPLQDSLLRSNDKLKKVYPIEPPKKEDKRHPRIEYHKDLEEYCKSVGKAVGVRHFGRWPPKGHIGDIWSKTGGPFGLVITSDSRGGKGKNPNLKYAKAAAEFDEETVPHKDSLGALQKALVPESWSAARAHLEEVTAVGNGEPEILGDLMCHFVSALVENSPCDFHLDPDDPEGMATWEVSGYEYGGAEVVMGPEGHMNRFRMMPGDTILAKACIVPHLVTPIVGGQRLSLVLTSKTSTKTAKKTAKDMTPEELAQAEFERDEKNRPLLEEENALIGSWKEERSRLDSILMEHLVNDPSKLQKAKDAKKREIKSARTAEEKHSLEQKPASLFYKLGKEESKREAVGWWNPFVPMTGPNSRKQPVTEGSSAEDPKATPAIQDDDRHDDLDDHVTNAGDEDEGTDEVHTDLGNPSARAWLDRRPSPREERQSKRVKRNSDSSKS